jgi:hypothetical protein
VAAALARRWPGRAGLQRRRRGGVPGDCWPGGGVALDGGPAAWGCEQDQRWTLDRVATLIARLFDVRYTLRGTSYWLKIIQYQPALIDGSLKPGLPSNPNGRRPQPFNL